MKILKIAVLLWAIVLAMSFIAKPVHADVSACQEDANNTCEAIHAGWYTTNSWAGSPVAQTVNGSNMCGYMHPSSNLFASIGGLPGDFECASCPEGQVNNSLTNQCECPDVATPTGVCANNDQCPDDAPYGSYWNGVECILGDGIEPPDPCEEEQVQCINSCDFNHTIDNDAWHCASSDDVVMELVCACKIIDEDTCPPSKLPVMDASGAVQSCVTPDDHNGGCPEITSYGTFNGNTGCFMTEQGSGDNVCDSGSGSISCANDSDILDSEGNPVDGSGDSNDGSGDGSGGDGSGGDGSGGDGSGSGSGDGSGDGSGEGTGSGGGGGSSAASEASLESIDEKMPTGLTSEEEESEHTPETAKDAFMASWERMKDAPVIGATDDIFGGWSDDSGSCPAITFQAFGDQISTSFHCEMFDQVKGFLSPVMLAFWSIIAVLIFRRA